MEFTGLSAFPLTPLSGEEIDWHSFERIIGKLVAAKVDSLGVLGSTGSYPYLSREERRKVIETAVEHAQGIPVMAGIGALRTRDVLALTDDAQKAGASAVLLAPVSYQPLSDEEVFSLYESVSQTLSVPLCIYHNPRTTQFTFSPELLARIAGLPRVSAVKVPPAAVGQIASLRARLPGHITLGISGDASAVEGLIAGCDMWCSVIGGLFPQPAMQMVEAVSRGDLTKARELSNALAAIWALFNLHGGQRVIATAAELTGDVQPNCLPQPLQTLRGAAREQLRCSLMDTGILTI